MDDLEKLSAIEISTNSVAQFSGTEFQTGQHFCQVLLFYYSQTDHHRFCPATFPLRLPQFAGPCHLFVLDYRLQC